MSTKFTLALLVLAIASLLLLFDQISPEIWMQVTIADIVVYGGGNVTATWAHGKAAKG